MSFSATEATFEGFRLVRRNPLALVAWALLYAVVSVASLFAVSRAMGPLARVTEMAEAMEGVTSPPQADVAALLQALGEVFLNMGWLFPLSIVVGAMLAAAVARGVLTPKAGGFGYLKLGMDEVRVIVVSLVLSLLSMVLLLVLIFAVGIAVGIAQASGGGIAVLAAVVVGLAGAALLIWLAVRLCLAVPITVAEKRIAIFDSFAVTKGRFWPLLGMIILTAVMVIIIGVLSSIITMPLGMMSGLEPWSLGSGASDMAAMQARFDLSNPWVIASAFVEAVVYALTVGVLYAPFAAAYRDITGSGAEAPTV
ncbi:hypothetical protein [uncultured Brevundimonas sp.]|uniref:hypothetical protein n=1 Tax=uncultured Brevundimonas sp. TaxID=213418 RepID=UPI0030EB9239|tara:strand:+ start:15475 stop:16404 length:930 start_codon:yes stop_codon:yes gene_type:complete